MLTFKKTGGKNEQVDFCFDINIFGFNRRIGTASGGGADFYFYAADRIRQQSVRRLDRKLTGTVC
jgi:hypothetical protein